MIATRADGYASSSLQSWWLRCSASRALASLYRYLLSRWNERDADGYAALFDDAETLTAELRAVLSGGA